MRERKSEIERNEQILKGYSIVCVYLLTVLSYYDNITMAFFTIPVIKFSGVLLEKNVSWKNAGIQRTQSTSGHNYYCKKKFKRL